ncbi:thiol:disulfide interchange protein DsbA [Pantoea sp. Aalb]|uniref:thiol:disulfide interchange protein DsbA n=1 Tax=Pantoea sp. Aalb TaxID=2576762 RepID=UPI001326E07B|nr:thiol:disulfide interchange protein DsbA [Pantoea sp. Aalb]MXP67961.1 thiol:disulfide interchange protein DsbA [Pantoea sp. Aalb]
MKKIWFLLLNLIFIFNISAEQFDEGNQYITLSKRTTIEPQVLEFFSFFCSHCYDFERIYHINDTIQNNLPIGIKLIKYHVDFLGSDLGHTLTHAWAVAIALGVEDKVIAPIFDGIQKDKNIFDSISLKNIFIKATGISSKYYDLAWNSFVVRSLILQQQKAALQFDLHGVPAFFINGKYMINNSRLDTSTMHNFINDYVNIINFLIKKN